MPTFDNHPVEAHRVIRRRPKSGFILGIVALAAFSIYGCGPSPGTPLCADSGTWRLAAEAYSGGMTVTGTITLDGMESRTNLILTHAEGWTETIEDPLEIQGTEPDSIRFQFSPIGFKFVGSCASSNEWAGEFAVPQPPFEDISGAWSMIKETSP